MLLPLKTLEMLYKDITEGDSEDDADINVVIFIVLFLQCGL